MSQMPTAFNVIIEIWRHSTCPLLAIPRTTVRVIIPNTSSITAAERIVTPSGEFIFFFSERIRALIPTEVAVEITPRKSGIG